MTGPGTRRPAWRRVVLPGAVLALALLAGAALILDRQYEGTRSPAEEAAAIAGLLELPPGARVAEIGAGDGAIALEVARIVGPGGRVFASELDAPLVDTIARRAAEARLTNLTTVRAGDQDTNLPDRSCQAIFMRRVYHDLTSPAAIVGSMARALTPGGRIAIIDFEPTLIGNLLMPRRASRSGHGVTRSRLVEEMRGFGFAADRGPADWSGGMFAAVFRAAEPDRGRNAGAARLALLLPPAR